MKVIPDDIEEDWQPRYNIAPTQTVPAIRQADEGRELAWFRWGLVPFWSKELPKSRPVINAKAETIAEKPSFRAAFKHRRCLIPATGFYEWQKTDGKKQPFHIHMQDDTPFAMAGLWERWDRGSEPLESCTIITTAANDLIADIHDRMPVILHADDYDAWLDPTQDDADALRGPLVPWAEEGMTATLISAAACPRRPMR